MSRKRTYVRSRHVATYTEKHSVESDKTRLRLAAFFVMLFSLLIVCRLFFLMVMQHGFYTALAAGSHTLYEQLYPERGSVFIQDSRTGEEFALAINKDVFTVFVDTRQLDSEEERTQLFDTFVETFDYRVPESPPMPQSDIDFILANVSSTPEQIANAEKELERQKKQRKIDYLKEELWKTDDPYVPIEQEVEESVVDALKSKELVGIGFVRHSARYYPEGRLAAQTIGFVGKTDEGKDIGRYGIEGYWQEELAGTGGFLEASKSRAGWIIPLADRSFEPAEDGSDILLTLDRTLQYKACERLKQGFLEYGATSASLLIINPKTGAILAMCSFPDFDPNEYGHVDDVRAYNNTNIFTPYEPGSIFKPITMAAAINEGVVTPDTTFFDSGTVDAKCTKPIENALSKAYQEQTMTGVLENSINTGMVFVINKLGKHPFISYLESYGFGVKTGVTLDSEISGTIGTLSENKSDTIDCYTATASFGQGITATPLQMLTAFEAIANKGKIMKPYVVQEIRRADGKVIKTTPEVTTSLLTERTAALVSAMMVRVIDTGQAKIAAVPGYYVAGKTGTAQIAGPGGYTADTNHSFVGFAPADDPAFVMLVKYEKPQRRFADSTAAPVFADVAKMILNYYQIPPER